VKSPISLPRARDVKNDLIAGLTTGLVQIPDAMASAPLAVVKPSTGTTRWSSARRSAPCSPA
jgi:MFS superfamily sulfate permease-like transporter